MTDTSTICIIYLFLFFSIPSWLFLLSFVLPQDCRYLYNSHIFSISELPFVVTRFQIGISLQFHMLLS